MNFKILPMKAKDYGETVCGEPIQNFHEWRDLISQGEIMGHSGDNREFFKKIFGKISFRWTGEFTFYCWLVDLETTQVIVLTAKDYGTCYEVVTRKNGEKVRKDPSKVVEFMKWISSVNPQRKLFEKIEKDVRKACQKHLDFYQ